MKFLKNKFALLSLAVLIGASVFVLTAPPRQVAAAPVPAQCSVNINVLGGAAVYARFNCSEIDPAGTYADGTCYNADQKPGRPIDCAAAPINNQWKFKCVDGVEVTSPMSKDPDQVCAARGTTYTPAGTAPPATPVAAPITGTTPPATAPSTGSGATTTTEQVTFPEGTLDPYKAPVNNGEYYCGSNPQSEVKLAIDLGCKGKDPAILDLMFAIIRLLSIGVGIVVVGSVIFAGIQYTASRGNPQEVAAAQERIRSAIIALLLFIFTYAILNWIVPAGVLK